MLILVKVVISSWLLRSRLRALPEVLPQLTSRVSQELKTSLSSGDFSATPNKCAPTKAVGEPTKASRGQL